MANIGNWEEWDKIKTLESRILAPHYELHCSIPEAQKYVEQLRNKGSHEAALKLERIYKEISRKAFEQIELEAEEIAKMLVPQKRVAIGQPHNMMRPNGKRYTREEVEQAEEFIEFIRNRPRII